MLLTIWRAFVLPIRYIKVFFVFISLVSWSFLSELANMFAAKIRSNQSQFSVCIQECCKNFVRTFLHRIMNFAWIFCTNFSLNNFAVEIYRCIKFLCIEGKKAKIRGPGPPLDRFHFRNQCQDTRLRPGWKILLRQETYVLAALPCVHFTYFPYNPIFW